MELVNHLGKKLLLPGLLDVMLYELDMQDPQKNNWGCLKKVRQSFRVPASWKSLPDVLQDTEKSDWQIANIVGTLFKISCFMEKSVGYYGPVGWRWVPQHYRRTLSDISVNSRVFEVTYNGLPAYWGNIIYSSGVFDGIVVIVFLS